MLDLIHATARDNTLKGSFPKTRFIEMIYNIDKIQQICHDVITVSGDNDYVDLILKTDFKHIRTSKKGVAFPELYDAILKVYSDDNSKEHIVNSYRYFLKKRKCEYDEEHLNLFKKNIRHILKKSSIKPYDKDLILSCDDIEHTLYYVIKYAITGYTSSNYKDKNFLSYWDDFEEYSNIYANNLLGGNINDRGLKNVLAHNPERIQDQNKEHINTVAQFDKGVRLLFGNAPDYIKDHTKALICFEDILAANPVMPLANWGVAYIVFYYTSTYTDRHKNVKVDKYQKAYELAKKASEFGCAAAYNLLGIICRDYKREKPIVHIGEFDKTNANYYFKISLNYGYYFALNNIGDSFLQLAYSSMDDSLKKENLKSAFESFKDLADLAYEAYACNMVGTMIMGEYGDFGEPQDKKKAFKYWKLAIENDDSGYNSYWSKYNIVKYLYNNCNKNLFSNEHDSKIINESYEYVTQTANSQKHSYPKYINACTDLITELKKNVKPS